MNRGSSLRQEGIRILPAIILGLLLTFYTGLGLAVSSRAFSVDFIQLYASSRSSIAGESLYTPLRTSEFGRGQEGLRTPSVAQHPNLNPPVLALLVAPLTVMGLPGSYLAWMALSLLAGLVGCVLMHHELRQTRLTDAELVWLWIVFLLYFPTYTALRMGQVTFGLLLPLAGAWLTARRGHDRAAGVLLGVAVSLKLFVGLVAIFFALQRRWTIVAWSAGTMLCVLLGTLPFVGIGAYAEYFATLRSVTWFASNWNASYAAVVTRVLGGSENVPLFDLPRVSGLVLFGCSTVTLVWFAWLLRVPSGAHRVLVQFDLGFGLSLVVMLLVSPLGWIYYFPLLALPGYMLWTSTRSGGLRGSRIGLCLAWALSSIPTSFTQAADMYDPLSYFTVDSLYFYALFVLMVVLSRELRRANRGSHTSAADQARHTDRQPRAQVRGLAG